MEFQEVINKVKLKNLLKKYRLNPIYVLENMMF